jgi:NAD(P)-dependent dehydrogenase (short-subunit alcohol dehydrogenase family)
MPRRILILGASSTLGKATADWLHAQGERLWATCRCSEKLPLLAQALPQVRVSCMDALKLSEIKSLRCDVQEQWGGLEGLVCAFGWGQLKPVHRSTEAEVTSLTDLNLESLHYIGREFYPLLLNGCQPAVVLFSSTMGLAGAAGMSVYAATKAGVAGLARAWAIEWAPRRIRVNAIAPGIIPSPMVESMFANLAPEQVEFIRARHPLGFGEPADVAHAVSFLLSPAAKWITGVVLPVDGGYTAQ